MNYALISQIIRGNWAIDPQFAINSAPLINDLLKGNVVFEQSEDEIHSSVVMSTENSLKFGSLNNAPERSIAIIEISGALFKADRACGQVGMATIGQTIQEADSNPNISGIILKIDSPGGTVDGTSDLADIIKSSQKQTVAFVDGLMASAALWLGSSCDYVFASNDLAQVGSVGVLLSFQDVQPALEKQGVNFHTIVAPQSTEKVKMFEELRAGNYENYKNEVLQPLAEAFINVVKTNRPNVEEKHLKGKVFFAKDVLGAFVDEIGTLNDAVNYILDSQEKIISNKNSNTMEKTFARLNSVLGVDLQLTEEGSFLNEEQLDLVENALEATDNTELENQVSDLTSDLDTANSTISDLQTQVANLKKTTPKAKPAKVVVENDKNLPKGDKNIVSDDKSFIENLDAISEEYL